MPRWRPDIVLLDIMMPGFDGYEICRRIRADDRYRSTKVILVSGKASVDERLEGYAAGADDYIVKPFFGDELLAKIRVFGRLSRSEEVDRLRRDILHLFSHETRTPLNIILGLAGIMMDDESLPEEARQHVIEITASGNTLLEFARKAQLLCDLKSGIALAPQPGSLAQQINQLVERHQEQSAATFKLELEDDGRISADWRFVEEAVATVLANAAKFCVDSPIDVTLRRLPDGYLIQVADRGPGFDPEHLRHICEPFGIWDVNHHRQGQGLSLAISREILELHGGFLIAENRHDGGAIFSLGLPFDPQGVIAPAFEITV
jgi:signal transduction histidine kinase